MSALVIPQIPGKLLERAQSPESRLRNMSALEMAEVLAGIPAPSAKIKVGTTYPPIQAYLTDVGGPFDLGVMSTLTFAIKGATVGPLLTGAGVSNQVTFTATTAIGSPTLSSVSSFTNLFGPLPSGAPGSILVGPGIPPPTFANGLWSATTVLALNPGAGTITMSANASANGSGVSVVGNKGLGQYTLTTANWATPLLADTYLVEWKMVLTSPVGAIMFFPSEADLNQSIEIDATLGE